VKSDLLFSGYWNDQAATDAALRDGYYWTGDLAVMDDDGYLKLVGRKKDLIISGGYNVYPIEVENALADHPAVRDVAVIGLPDPKWGEAVHAIVVAHDGTSVSADELIEHCRARIASYKKPRSVEFVDQMPRTTVGKVAKNVLREQRTALTDDSSPS
jgi:long-chain acyl-CoA synthetase